jgi:hypothetical protein
MRFMVIVKACKDSEAGVLPTKELLAEMGKFNEKLVRAGVMLAADGLHASSKGKRVRFSEGKTTVIDGPFAQAGSIRRRRRSRDSPDIRGGGLRSGVCP